jgi:hypothetical protein
MRLFELAYCCRLYGDISGYDASLAHVWALGPTLDPYDATHRTALFVWLNAWGCRQFTKKHHATIASDSLVRWAAEWLSRLPGPDAQLAELSPLELATCAAAYDDLRIQTAGLRRWPDGHDVAATYGPTGAAKTLFAIRPGVFPPWDDPIRAHFGYGADQTSFGRYLSSVAALLRELASEAGGSVADLPALVGRPHSSPPKLIDEYNWMVVTKGYRPPTADEVRSWATWASARS